jgi:hypothetical protein
MQELREHRVSRQSHQVYQESLLIKRIHSGLTAHFLLTDTNSRMIMEDIFPKRDIEYSNLQVTDEGRYSVTRRRDGEHILAIMHSTVGNLKDKSITDATACVG